MAKKITFYIARGPYEEQIGELKIIQGEVQKYFKNYEIKLLPQIAITKDFFNGETIKQLVSYLKDNFDMRVLHLHGRGRVKNDNDLNTILKKQVDELSRIKQELNLEEITLNMHLESVLGYSDSGIEAKFTKDEFLREAEHARENLETIVSYAHNKGVTILIEASGHLNFRLAMSRDELRTEHPDYIYDERQLPWNWIPEISQQGDFLGTRKPQDYFLKELSKKYSNVGVTLDLGHIIKTILYSIIFEMNNSGKTYEKLLQTLNHERYNQVFERLGLVRKDGKIYKVMFKNKEVVVPELKKEDKVEGFDFYLHKGKPIIFEKPLSFNDFKSEHIKLYHLHSETGAAMYDMIPKGNHFIEVRKIPSHAPFIKYTLERDDFIQDELTRTLHSNLQEFVLDEILESFHEEIGEKGVVLEINVPEKNHEGPVYLGETYRDYMVSSLRVIIEHFARHDLN